MGRGPHNAHTESAGQSKSLSAASLFQFSFLPVKVGVSKHSNKYMPTTFLAFLQEFPYKKQPVFGRAPQPRPPCPAAGMKLERVGGQILGCFLALPSQDIKSLVERTEEGMVEVKTTAPVPCVLLLSPCKTEWPWEGCQGQRWCTKHLAGRSAEQPEGMCVRAAGPFSCREDRRTQLGWQSHCQGPQGVGAQSFYQQQEVFWRFSTGTAVLVQTSQTTLLQWEFLRLSRARSDSPRPALSPWLAHGLLPDQVELLSTSSCGPWKTNACLQC